jgi:alkylation response protein AidB-like acyl-CoA dehydrogenase
MLRDSLDRYLAANHDAARRRAVRGSALRFDESLWHALRSELGVAGVGFDEEDGGVGGTLADQCVVLESLGGSLAAEPYFGSVVVGGAFLRHSRSARARQVLAGVLDGSLQAALVQGCRRLSRERNHGELRACRSGPAWVIDGSVSVVHGAPGASHLIVAATPDEAAVSGRSCLLAVIERRLPGLELAEFDTIDGGRAADVHFRQVSVAQEDLLHVDPAESPAICDSELDLATILICAEGLGVLRRMLDDTLAYARERRQFGQPLAQFQVLRHRMVDMHLQIEQCDGVVRTAAAEAVASPEQLPRLASLAKWQMSRACRRVSEAAVQIHGAIGTTEELHLADYFKRALVIGSRFGNEEFHRKRFQSLLF